MARSETVRSHAVVVISSSSLAPRTMKHKPYKRRHPMPALSVVLRYASNKISGVHPACEAVTKIGPRDFDNLVDSIKHVGLLRPIEIDREKRLVDGRSRLMACFVAGVKLQDVPIVETDVDAAILARANIDRRHLTRDQRTMYSLAQLDAERTKAKQRQLSGAKKGRENRSKKLGGNLVPSKNQSRAPRATERVAKENGVPREDVKLAEKIREKSPAMAEQVAQGEISLKSAAEQLQLKPQKTNKTKAPKSQQQTTQDGAASSPKTGVLFSDDRSLLANRSDGVRIYSSWYSSVYQHERVSHDVYVIFDGLHWRTGMPGELDDKMFTTREEAEEQGVLLISVLVRLDDVEPLYQHPPAPAEPYELPSLG